MGTVKGTSTCKLSAFSSSLLTMLALPRFVEFETAADLSTAVEKLDNREFKGRTVHCVANVSHSLTSLSVTIQEADVLCP
jgi:hypothetical protein